MASTAPWILIYLLIFLQASKIISKIKTEMRAVIFVLYFLN